MLKPADGRIPFVDLSIQRDRVRAEVAAGFERVLADTSFVLGPEVTSFEQEYAVYCGTKFCAGVANGTDALELALRAAGVGPGDEVIVPVNTFVATAEAVVRTGATLVLVDCGEDFLIDPKAVQAAQTPRTRAVIAVHLYGQLADVGGLRKVVNAGVLVIEDAAQSQGASRSGARSGALGDVAATSFYPGKNLGAYGDAGAITTNDPDIAEAVRRLRNHGGTQRYEHQVVGANSRLDSLQAVVLRAKLRHLDTWNEERRAVADMYARSLEEISSIVLPYAPDELAHVWHLYVVQVEDRDALAEDLAARGISTGVHYPAPIHLLPAFAGMGLARGTFPVAERMATQILSLPVYPGMTSAQQERVAGVLTTALRNRTGAASGA